MLDGGVFVVGWRVNTTPEALAVFAASLTGDDHVALEVTGNAWEIARILQGRAGRVLVVNPSETGIAQARAKTDRLCRAADERAQVRRALAFTGAAHLNELRVGRGARGRGSPTVSLVH